METVFEPYPVAHFSDALAARTQELLHRPGFLSEVELVGLVQRIAGAPGLWRPLVILDRRRRRYELLFEDEYIDVWVLSWMPGQRTGYHDHDRSRVGLVCAQGSLDESSLVIGGSAETIEMTVGISRSGADGYIHAVAHREGEPAVSIHAYSPPLTCVGQYRAGPGGRLRREREHGRKELKDTTIPLGTNHVESVG